MALSLKNISLKMEGETWLDDVSLTLERGELCTVIGRTLAGKTTLLRVLAGLQEIDSGSLELDGRDTLHVPIWERGVAMVYQQFINYPHLDVLANVAFPLRRHGVPRAEAARRAAEVLASVGLSGYEKRKPSELSGGQQQRVALARALGKRSDLLLLDEPLVNLDYKLREQLRREFRNLFSQQRDSIVVYTTTEPSEAMLLGNRMVVLHEGRILQIGSPADVFSAPADIRVAQIVNDPPMNMIEGGLVDGALRLHGDVALPIPAHMKALEAGDYVFGIRALDTHLSGGIEARVELAEISGSETFVHVTSRLGPVVLQIDEVLTLALHEAVRIDLPAERLFVFGKDGRLVSSPEACDRGERGQGGTDNA